MIKMTSQNGFTFIEIIVAVTILGIITLTLYSLMDVGFSFWDYIDNTNWSYNDLQLAIKRMAKDIRCTFYRATSDRYYFKGNMYQVEFFKMTTEGEVKKLVYEYSPYDETIFINTANKKIPLLTQIERCNFYFYNSEYGYWDNYWDSMTNNHAPSMIRIEFAFINSDDNFSFDFPLYVGQKGISGR